MRTEGKRAVVVEAVGDEDMGRVIAGRSRAADARAASGAPTPRRGPRAHGTGASVMSATAAR